MTEVHIVRSKDDGFDCRACSWTGNLDDIGKHVVENQFNVEYKPSRPKLGGSQNTNKYTKKLRGVRYR